MSKLKVLFASIPQPKNRFVLDIKEGLEEHCEVCWDYNKFWECREEFDIVHIHEPEYLSFEIEQLQFKQEPFPENLWEELKNCLEYWSANSSIIHTRHVQEPHVRTDIEFQKLYSLVLSHCDQIAHFANYSITQFKELYPGLTNITHTVIPHQNYLSLPNTVSREEARQKLRIDEDAKVMLVFGFVKEHEKQLITKAFNAIPDKKKILLAPGWKVEKPQIGSSRLNKLIYNLKVWRAGKNQRFRINLGFIKEEDAQIYCNAADFLLTPRIHELNSGNITFGFTFGLVVIGKESADIGEILKENDNPTFNPFDTKSIENAVHEALKAQRLGQGEKNLQIAKDNWDIDTICKMYYDSYCKLVEKSKA